MTGFPRAEWLEDLIDLADRCVGAKELSAPDLLRALHTICQTGPAAISRAFGETMTGDELEVLISEGAFESAALRMIRPGHFTLSGGGTRPIFAASVVFYGTEFRFGADSETVALIGAIATALHDESLKQHPPERRHARDMVNSLLSTEEPL